MVKKFQENFSKESFDGGFAFPFVFTTNIFTFSKNSLIYHPAFVQLPPKSHLMQFWGICFPQQQTFFTFHLNSFSSFVQLWPMKSHHCFIFVCIFSSHKNTHDMIDSILLNWNDHTDHDHHTWEIII